MRLKEIMTTQVRTVPPGMPAEEAYATMRSERIRHLVVAEGKEVVGVLSEGDLGGLRGKEFRRSQTVSDLASGATTTASSRTTIREAANLMRGQSIGCLPIVDQGKLVGIVTVSDLLDLLGRGAERPVPSTTRWVMRNRGSKRQTTARMRSSMALGAR